MVEDSLELKSRRGRTRFGRSKVEEGMEVEEEVSMSLVYGDSSRLLTSLPEE